MVKGRSAKLPGRPLLRHKGEKSAEEHYEQAAGLNDYSVAPSISAYHGCILEAGRAFNAMSICVFRELSSDVWTGRVKDYRMCLIIGMRNSIGDHRHRREAQLEAVGSGWAPPLGGRIEASRHTEDLRRMRNEAEVRINSGKSAFGRNSGGNSAGRAFGHGDLSWIGGAQ
jgi:uncharacterized membrane protein YgcG